MRDNSLLKGTVLSVNGKLKSIKISKTDMDGVSLSKAHFIVTPYIEPVIA